MEKYGKTALFPGGYSRIGEIPHGRIWLDWGLKGLQWCIWEGSAYREEPECVISCGSEISINQAIHISNFRFLS